MKKTTKSLEVSLAPVLESLGMVQKWFRNGDRRLEALDEQVSLSISFLIPCEVVPGGGAKETLLKYGGPG